MANVFTLDNLNYTYPGQISSEIFYKPSVMTPDFLKLFSVQTGINYKRQLQLATPLAKIVKADPGCGTITTAGTVDNPNRTLEVCDLFFRVEQCFDTFSEKWLVEELPSGIDKATLGSFIENMIQKLIVDSLRRDNFRIFSFGDANDADTDYNQCDGLWRRLIDGEATYEVDKVDAITVLNQTAGTRALDYLQNLYNGANVILKQIPKDEKIFAVTGNFYENLLTTWESTELKEGRLGLQQNQDGNFLFRGIEVLPIYSWDADLADTANPFNAVFDTGVIYTQKENHVVGVQKASDLGNMRQFYWDIDRKVYFEGTYKMGYNYTHGDLTAISYGVLA